MLLQQNNPQYGHVMKQKSLILSQSWLFSNNTTPWSVYSDSVGKNATRFSPQVQRWAAALVLEAVALLVDFGGRFGWVALHHGVVITQTLKLIISHPLPIDPKTQQISRRVFEKQIITMNKISLTSNLLSRFRKVLYCRMRISVLYWHHAPPS